MPRCTCPCGARYKVPETSLGKKSKCKKCAAVFTLEADEEGILAIAPEPESEHVSAFAMEAQAAARSAKAAAARAHPEEQEAEQRAQAPVRSVVERSYATDVLWTFLFPSSPSNLITFIGACAVRGILLPLAMMAPWIIGFIFWLVILGWYAGFRFEVVRIAASGQDNLPSIDFTDDLWGDAIEPFLNWIESWVVVMLPAVIYLVVCMNRGTITGMDLFQILFGGLDTLLATGKDELWLLSGLVWGGLALWPIVVLCIALGGLGSLARVDLIATTILATLPGYVLTLAMVASAVALQEFLLGRIAGGAAAGAGSGVSGSPASVIGAGLAVYGLLTCLEVYIDIVVMRLIGLYYHHFKRKFAWEWE